MPVNGESNGVALTATRSVPGSRGRRMAEVPTSYHRILSFDRTIGASVECNTDLRYRIRYDLRYNPNGSVPTRPAHNCIDGYSRISTPSLRIALNDSARLGDPY